MKLIFLCITFQDAGVDFNLHGNVCNFRGTISLVSADNLAAWDLGGYKALASALRKCQFCMAVSADMMSKVVMHCIHVIHVCALMSVHVCVCTRVCMRACIRMCVRSYMCTCVCMCDVCMLYCMPVKRAITTLVYNKTFKVQSCDMDSLYLIGLR